MAKINLVQVGVGSVGRELINQIRDDERFQYTAIYDSKAVVYAPKGISQDQLDEILEIKRNNKNLIHLPYGKKYDDVDFKNCIIIDLTASDKITKRLIELSKNNFIILANKKPLSGPYEDFEDLIKSGRVYHEATVGAGLPIISTLNHLQSTGDEILEIEGCFSGTLGYICSKLDEGGLFSEIVKEAKELGYTEPDPRDDLDGMDVARKILILARVADCPIELEEVEVHSMISKELTGLSLSRFWEALPMIDKKISKKVEEAKKQGCVLRYVANIDDNKISVGLKKVKKDSMVGGLTGPDNIVLIKTKRYSENPLIIIGPGAGLEVTASGVYSDILKAAERIN